MDEDVAETRGASESSGETDVEQSVTGEHGERVACTVRGDPSAIRDHVIRDVDAGLDRDLDPALDGRAEDRVARERLRVARELPFDVLDRLAQDEEPPTEYVTIDQ